MKIDYIAIDVVMLTKNSNKPWFRRVLTRAQSVKFAERLGVYDELHTLDIRAFQLSRNL